MKKLILPLSLISVATPVAVVAAYGFLQHLYIQPGPELVTGVVGAAVLSGYLIRREARLAVVIAGAAIVAVIVLLLSLFALLDFFGE